MSVAPPAKSLLPQQFYWDTSVAPGRVWAGVPLTEDPTGLDLVLDTGRAGAMIGTAAPGNVPGPLWWDSNSGQLFIQYNDGSSTQWVSANSIDASTLEGSFLPITGGTVTGPLNYTATGGTVSRSAQDRAADVANGLDYGADPTGVADSSTAINAAAAVLASGPDGKHKSVYLPAGIYRVNHQITLTGSQALFGDSRGSSRLYVDQAFSPTDTSVILCRAAFQDAGPVIHDLGITFAQPLSQTSRANFKTLAAGGTSGAGGTGIRYPWAIAAGDSSFRIQISRVRISRAWDGITSNNFNAVFWLDDVEMSAFDCGLSLGEGPTGIQDFCHINAYHFWNFDFADSDPLFSVFADGNTIAMRVGRVDGLDIKGFTSLMGRLVVTPDSAGATSIHIANCMLDTDQATIDINGDMLQFQISNMYGVAGTGRLRPLVSVNAACNLNITNYYSHSTSNFSEFLLTNDNAIVGITNFRAMFYTTNIPWAEVRQGFLRITNGYLFTPARTVAAIAETVNGRLVVDNITVTASGGATTGPLISMVTANAQSSIGRLALDPAAAWTFTIPAGVTQQFYSPQTQFFGAVFGKSLIQAGVATGGSQGTVAITGAAGEQKALMYQRGANPGWGIMAQGASDDLNIARWDNAGTFLGNALSINRAAGTTTFGSGISFGSTTVTGVDLSRHVSLYDGYAGFNVTSGAMNFVITGTVPLSVIGSAAGLAMPLLRTSTSFANDAAAATGGVPVGGIYRNASQVMVRVT